MVEKPYKCDQCHSSHISKNSLHKHKSVTHSEKKRLEELCKQCNRNIPKRLFNRHMEKVHNVTRYTFNIVKEGIFLSNTDRYFKEIKKRWQNFCNISYHDHQNPPSEEIFLDYFQKKKEAGKSRKVMTESYRCLCKVNKYTSLLFSSLTTFGASEALRSKISIFLFFNPKTGD